MESAEIVPIHAGKPLGNCEDSPAELGAVGSSAKQGQC